MTSTQDDEMRIRVLLSMQRALWDMVTPDLRGVAVSWGSDWVRARFIYESDRSENEELVREIETEVLADFDEQLTTQFESVSAPAPQPRLLRDGEAWVYLRREL